MAQEPVYVYMSCRQWEVNGVLRLSSINIWGNRENAERDARLQNEMLGAEHFVVVEQEVF